ncbi:ABC transporter permease subunit [Rhodobacteraceae bacterium RKSG542]|uniref:ABC transporter permease subunit n=1 Tax=Pseudovibrio flavus TaxID=2529854 RepID=UPI0012BC7B33|nr:ABC transporter permease subunit [Pseudovibrio flavus]MTI18394.1 ABC transporter permease subunit [Pseudovibrio flavus]
MRVKLMDHMILCVGVLFMTLPALVVFFSSTHSGAVLAGEGLQLVLGQNGLRAYERILFEGRGFSGAVTGLLMIWNSMALALGFALGKVLLSMLAAYALVYFRVRFGTLIFWLIFTSLLLPLESRFLATYGVVSNLGLVNTKAGLILPLLASAIGTFFFRQFFLTVPNELVEAARIDGAGPIKFLKDILAPASAPMVAALFLLMFVLGWNQYLWPIMVNSAEEQMTVVQGIMFVGQRSPEGMALAVLAMLPPVLLVVFFQRYFVKGLTDGRQ